VKWEEAKADLQYSRLTVAEKAPPQPTLLLRKNRGPGPLSRRWTWAWGGITSFHVPCFQGHYPTNPYSKSNFPVVTETFEKPNVTVTRKTARPQKSEPKVTAAPKLAAGKSKKTAPPSVKTTAAKPTTHNVVPPPHWRKFLISSITFSYLHVWSGLVGFAHPSPPFPQG
jgi:hypothetical protein